MSKPKVSIIVLESDMRHTCEGETRFNNKQADGQIHTMRKIRKGSKRIRPPVLNVEEKRIDLIIY